MSPTHVQESFARFPFFNLIDHRLQWLELGLAWAPECAERATVWRGRIAWDVKICPSRSWHRGS